MMYIVEVEGLDSAYENSHNKRYTVLELSISFLELVYWSQSHEFSTTY